jgi:hypothetical protein
MSHEEYNDFQNNAADYQNNIWFALNSDKKKDILRETDRLAFESYFERHGIKPPEYKSPDIVIDRKAGGNGYYNDTYNITTLGKDSRTKYDKFSTMSHEGTHHAQNALAWADRSDMTPEQAYHADVIQSQYCYRETSTFGIESIGRMYIACEIPGELSGREALRSAFYASQPLEREAFNAETEFRSKFNQLAGKKAIDDQFINQLQQDLISKVIRGHYDCSGLTDAQIYQTLENAHMNVYNGTTPANGLEASMTYDYATLLYPQGDRWDIGAYKRMTGVEEKSLAMQEAGFQHTNTVPLNQIGQYSIDAIQSMLQITRDQNPILMTIALYKYGEDVIPLISRDSYDQWYFSDKNNMKDEVLDKVANVLGQKYSHERRLEIMNSQTQEIATQAQAQDVVSVEALFDDTTIKNIIANGKREFAVIDADELFQDPEIFDLVQNVLSSPISSDSTIEEEIREIIGEHENIELSFG